MQLLMEDILQSGYDVVMEDHAEWQMALAKKKQNLAEVDESCANGSERSRKTCKALPRLHNPVTSCALLRSFLITWKQLEVLKVEWGRLKLKVNRIPLYKQFTELYGTDIQYPAMGAIARHLGTDNEFAALVTSSRSILPPKGATETEVKMRQFQMLLESLKIHMVHDVQKKINQEMTLVTSERARAGSCLPTGLWQHRVTQENFSVVRPQIVETFVQRLMENYQQSDVELMFKKCHLQNCLTALCCDIMARERSNFETYSMFYENLLQQEHQLHYQKEQELHAVEDERLTDMNLSQETLQNKEECLNVKMLAEQEVLLFRQQLVAVRKALAKSQAENEKLNKQLDKQKHLLQEVEHKMIQEARSRHQLDVMKAVNMEKMLEEIGQKEQRLQCLTEDAEKSSKIVQLQQKQMKKDMRQIRSQLIQEHNLKLDAFQQVDELQSQIYDLEAVMYQRSTHRYEEVVH
ncbi:coiled-coil domain-containing protein 162-like [Carettochelys insculpta]|uniref:coiled-coil domain-containing protein 162-like n=1 Tax=Carettochelys insculpta TaxID=44489 RepID=UPI003EB7E79C